MNVSFFFFSKHFFPSWELKFLTLAYILPIAVSMKYFSTTDFPSVSKKFTIISPGMVTSLTFLMKRGVGEEENVQKNRKHSFSALCKWGVTNYLHTNLI